MTPPVDEMEGENERDYGAVAGTVTSGVAVIGAAVIGRVCWA
ncbi:hypothetical protein [Endozoicomonas numazuensis]|nr:hypothetical protein [Endozoicomonas numazuensis]